MSKVTVVGVRHHSPACARLVEHTLREVKPDFVLIEGPADFNPRISELTLPHKPPVAIFSYFQDGLQYQRSFSPFCSYSPEWVALQVGKELGAQTRFMDLPSWTRAFRLVENRYHDEDRSRDYVAKLCQTLSLQGMDELWDHLFEQPQPLSELRDKLTTYFDNLRASSVAAASDEEREQFMAEQIAWAATQGSVVAICGGFHKPVLEELWPQCNGAEPATPVPEGGRYGSFLVPYSFYRLDSFTGYGAGMPSPRYYEMVWQKGADKATEVALRAVVKNLRQAKLAVSAADLIACESMTEGLRRLRGHSVPARADLLDGLAASLVKHGLDRPLPWTNRGPLPKDTDPILAEIVKALSGKKEGKLARDTPLPPLVGDVQEKLEELNLTPTKVERKVMAKLGSTESHVLHQLQLIEIPGFSKESEELGEESWSLLLTPDFESAVIEAGALGATLEEAAFSKVEEATQKAIGFTSELARLLVKAFRAGLRELPGRLLDLLREQAANEQDFAALGGAAGAILSLWRSFREETLKELLSLICDRMLWLFELSSGPEANANQDELKALRSLLECYRILDLDQEIALEVMRRRSADNEAPPAHRGAALGFLWTLDTLVVPLDETLEALRNCSHPRVMGDFLAGLFALAREEVTSQEPMIMVVDSVLAIYSPQEFLVALPSMRLAFSFFPPREKEAIAALVLRARGMNEAQAWQLVDRVADPQQNANFMAIEEELEELLGRYGLS